MEVKYTRCDSCSFVFDKIKKFCPKCNMESIIYESNTDEYLGNNEVFNIND